MKNINFVLGITIVLLISILACCLTSCRSINNDLSSDNSSVVSTIEIDYLKIFSDKYISISENEKEDLDSLNNSKVLYEELLISINDYANSITDAEKEEYENLKELVETEFDSINQKITDLTTIENSSQEVTTSEVTSTASVETPQNATISETQTESVTIPQETIPTGPVNTTVNMSGSDYFIFPEGSNCEVVFDVNGKISDMPRGTVVIKENPWFSEKYNYSTEGWKCYYNFYRWTENGVWELYDGGTSMLNEEIVEWTKYGLEYIKQPNRNGSYVGEEVDQSAWVWMP